MAGPNTIIRIVVMPVVLLILMFVAWVGVKLFEPIDSALGVNAAGWTPVNFLFFMSLGLIGLVLVLFVWFWYAPIRNDVRQEQRRPPL
ncbi:MAG: hypothetical protein ABEI52_11790 [Halobacteriaceae archaeon]